MGRYEPYQKYPDNCERCSGASGGVRGNENVIDGRVLCDYCSCEVDGTEARYDLRCSDCTRPMNEHALMTMDEVAALWENGIGVPLCKKQWLSNDIAGMVLTWIGKDPNAEEEPDNPCDVDYMKEISS